MIVYTNDLSSADAPMKDNHTFVGTFTMTRPVPLSSDASTSVPLLRVFHHLRSKTYFGQIPFWRLVLQLGLLFIPDQKHERS